MIISDIFLSVKQELFVLGTYTEGRILNSEIALAFDAEINNIVAEIFKNLATEKTVFYNTLLLDLKKESGVIAPIKDFNSVTITLPPDYYMHIEDSTLVVKSGKLVTGKTLTIGKYYKVIEAAKVNGSWLEDGVIVKADQSVFYGNVEELTVVEINNRLTSSQKLNIQLQSNFYKPNGKKLLSELTSNTTLKVHFGNVCSINDIIGVNLVYYRKPFRFESINMQSESPYSDIVNNELITLVVERLKNRN